MITDHVETLSQLLKNPSMHLLHVSKLWAAVTLSMLELAASLLELLKKSLLCLVVLNR